MENQKIKRKHALTLDDGKISVSGVEGVDSSNAKILIIQVTDKTLTVTGDDFAIEKLDLDEGRLVAAGKVSALKYSSAHEKADFLKRLFK